MTHFQKTFESKPSVVTTLISVVAIVIPQGIVLSHVQAASVKQNRYPVDIVQSYLQGCNLDGQQAEFCNCTIDKLQQRYSLSQFETLATQMASTGTVPSALMKVASECVKIPAKTAVEPRPTNPTEVEQLNDQLRQAVDRKNWNQAIKIVDRLMLLFPEQTPELLAYRRRLESLRQP